MIVGGGYGFGRALGAQGYGFGYGSVTTAGVWNYCIYARRRNRR